MRSMVYGCTRNMIKRLPAFQVCARSHVSGVLASGGDFGWRVLQGYAFGTFLAAAIKDGVGDGRNLKALRFAAL